MTTIVQATADPPSAPLVQPVPSVARMTAHAARAPQEPVDSVKLTVGGMRQDLGATVTGTSASAAAVQDHGREPTENPLDRLDAVVATLQSQVETQTETRRHVVDAAMAAQAAHRSRMMILQDASLAISVQANPSPGTVLTLLSAE